MEEGTSFSIHLFTDKGNKNDTDIDDSVSVTHFHVYPNLYSFPILIGTSQLLCIMYLCGNEVSTTRDQIMKKGHFVQNDDCCRQQGYFYYIVIVSNKI